MSQSSQDPSVGDSYRPGEDRYAEALGPGPAGAGGGAPGAAGPGGPGGGSVAPEECYKLVLLLLHLLQ